MGKILVFNLFQILNKIELQNKIYTCVAILKKELQIDLQKKNTILKKEM
jgi:hypothetical protein